MRGRPSSALFVLVVSCVIFLACSRRQFALPRVELAAVSPDGEVTALVRNHPTIDPPSQSLWLRSAGGEPIQLRRLAPDQGWCNTIVWSADSSVVAFLVQDARLVVVDSRSAEVLLEESLVDPTTAYLTARKVTGLALSADGSQARYRRCPRRRGACSEPESLRIGDSRGEASASLAPFS